jgi:hypothetical protein
MLRTTVSKRFNALSASSLSTSTSHHLTTTQHHSKASSLSSSYSYAQHHPHRQSQNHHVHVRHISQATSFQSRKYMEWSTSSSQLDNWTENEQLKNWVLDRIKMLQPARVHLCDGSEQENKDLIRLMVHCGKSTQDKHICRCI